MDLLSPSNLRLHALLPPPTASSSSTSSLSYRNLSFQFWRNPFPLSSNKSFPIHAKKKTSQPPDPVLYPSIVEEVLSIDNEEQLEEEEEELLFDDFEDEEMMDEEDEYLEEDDSKLYVGDGGAGGGILLAGTWWDKEALRLVDEVCLSFDGELKIYAFKTLLNSTIQVRIERLTNKSGSPTMEDIEAFSMSYRARLDEAELVKTIPDNVALEVSSPGVERVVQIPDDLDWFKDRPMYVKYVSENVTAAEESSSESDGIFRLISFDMETKCCTWGLANVRVNREKAGKGRPLSKKQREWTLNTPFHSLSLVRLHSEI